MALSTPMKSITITKHQRGAIDRFIREGGEMGLHPITISSLVRKGLLEYKNDKLEITKECERVFSHNSNLSGCIQD